MVNEKYIVDGNDFKKLPLRAAYYARALGTNHDVRLKNTVDYIKDFTEHETSWDLIIGYEDNNCSSTCMCGQKELCEMLEDAYIPDDACLSDPFDIIVVTNFSQISRNRDVINYLFDEGILKVPVFCIETGKIVTYDPENMEGILLTCADINDSGEQVNENDYYMQKINEVNHDEE